MALEAAIGREDIYRVVLEQAAEGVYVYVYKHAESSIPDRDYLQADWEHAKSFCEHYLKIGTPSWREIPDEGR